MGHGLAQGLFSIIVILCMLMVAWWAAARWSPDPLITKIIQVAIFLVALYVAFFKILPMAGVTF
jgi:hypothetical protein